ncbi:hypothetical protein, partial [Oceanivirga salmonicida]
MIESKDRFFTYLFFFIFLVTPLSCYLNHNNKGYKKKVIKEYKEQKNIIMNKNEISVYHYSS